MHQTRKKVKRNLKTYILYMGLWNFAPHLIINILYFEHLLGSYALASMIFSIMFFSTTLVEIPIGVFSDMIGRRKTMILGSFFIFSSVLFYLLASYISFNPIYFLVIGGLCHGFGRAFFSGTDEAIVYETAKYVGERDFKKYFGRGRSISSFSGGTAGLLGGIISYYFSYELCYIVSLLVYSFLIFVTFFFYDVPSKHKESYKNTAIAHIKEAFSYFKKSSTLRILSVLNIIDDSIGGSVYRFEVAYLKLFIPEYMLGVFRFLRQLITGISYSFGRKFIIKYGPLKTLLISSTSNAFIRMIPLLLNNIATPIILLFAGIMNGPYVLSMSEKQQEEFSDEQRATMKSLITIFISFVEGLVIFALGALADIFSLQTSLIIIVSVKIIPIILCWKLIKMEKKQIRT